LQVPAGETLGQFELLLIFAKDLVAVKRAMTSGFMGVEILAVLC
jgi:hypothetical protein